MKLEEKNLSLRERVNSALSSSWKLAVMVLVAIIVAMTGILTADTLAKNMRNASSELAEDIQVKYTDWAEKEPDDRNDDELSALIDEALTEYPRYFAAQRALFTRARMNYEKENWAEAAENFEALARKWGKGYLSPVSLFNAASAWEQAGKTEDAKRVWNRLIEGQYTNNSPYVPEAIFNLGRIAESENNIQKALEHYGEISSLYPNSRWNNLAKSRVILLKSSSQ